jgi:hypothetical protein
MVVRIAPRGVTGISITFDTEGPAITLVVRAPQVTVDGLMAESNRSCAAVT